MTALPDDVRALFEGANYAHLATVLPSGAPHSVPVWTGIEGGHVVFFTQPASRKARNLARDPRVAFSITDHEQPYRMAQVRGRVVSTVEGDEALAAHLATWDTWQDISPYDGEPVPFFKRAQIAAADLALAGLGPSEGLDRLTLFADNLVPHVLRIDGVLEFDDGLVARIDAGELIEHDAPEEVEIRACALHAVELLVAAHPGPTTATAVDNHLWHRGGGPRYKAHPRHRARTTAY